MEEMMGTVCNLVMSFFLEEYRNAHTHVDPKIDRLNAWWKKIHTELLNRIMWHIMLHTEGRDR